MFTEVNKALFTFVNTPIGMDISLAYKSCCEKRLKGRYVALPHISPLLENRSDRVSVTTVGISEMRRPIYALSMGKGSKKVLAWSQMHGNESTTTKALFDFINFLDQKALFQEEVEHFLDAYTLLALPMLNPDGAELYTRENANGIDLNRDAKNQTQSESRVLGQVFEQFRPSLCLNLHDQRTLYGLKDNKPATLSFLAPSADIERSITPPRAKAMQLIASIHRFLQAYLPGQIGRYDDTFNEHCVGDRFQQEGVPTILFEAGHYQYDYQREKTREYVFYALMALLGMSGSHEKASIADYLNIPENNKRFRDVVLRNAVLGTETVDVAIQYREVLEGGTVHFVPFTDDFGNLDALNGHREIDLKGKQILINSYENVFVNEKVSMILDKKSKKPIKI